MKKKVQSRKNILQTVLIPPKVLGQLAEQVAKIVVTRMRRKKVKKKVKLTNPFFLDTSAIIDGRILDVGKLGFLWGTFIVPEFILRELKHIADNVDSLKRARGRHGLEVLAGLKKIKGVKLRIMNLEVEDPEIDEKLVKLAKAYRGRIITCDFNLNKKASVQGIQVLNVNELVNALKTKVLPGEELEVKIVEAGKEKGQGVGYLLDGTMIVVDKGENLVGEIVVVNVSRVFQTAAGRMIFTKIKADLV